MPVKILIVNIVADVLMFATAALSFKVKKKVGQIGLLVALILVFCINMYILKTEI